MIALQELIPLTVASALIASFYILLKPDHYLPLIALFRSGKWPLRKTIYAGILYGLGFVLSSLLLGTIGIALGTAISKLYLGESSCGTLAALVMIGFGLFYFDWGLGLVLVEIPLTQWHLHGNDYIHAHIHTEDHIHKYVKKTPENPSPWKIFTASLFNPCKPLILLFMYPAAKGAFSSLVMVAGVFGGVTIISMLSIVLNSRSISLVLMARWGRYIQVLTAITIFLCGIIILCLIIYRHGHFNIN